MKHISVKRQSQLAEYYALEEKLRELCGNRSELSGEAPDWVTKFLVKGHHINGRNGKRLLDVFNIVMVVNAEHVREQQYLPGAYGKEALLELVREIRLKQEFS